MISKATDVETYMAALPAGRRPAMEKLRRFCKHHLKGYEEAMQYGMPVYRRAGTVEISIASQKQYIALYVLKKDVLDEFRGSFAGLNLGKGCVRFPNPDRIDFDIVQKLLIRNVESTSDPC